jgi:hypothetical protein
MSLSDAVAGTRLEALVALRDDLAARLEACSSDQNYATMGRLMADVLAQIDAVRAAKPESEGTALDELASRRRAAGRPDSSAVVGTKRAAKRG